MNSINGGLEFQTKIDNSLLMRNAQEAENRIKLLSNNVVSSSKKMESSFSDASKALGAIGGTFALTMLGKQILDTTAKFEKFGIILRNSLGTEAGNQALAMISEFAIKTPFQLDEITDSFIKMANQGFKPTQEEMTKLGDIASSTGKSFNQLAEAILDAQTNQFERLREFGITASQTQDKVTFTFREQQTTVDKTSSSIRNYLLSLGDLKGIQGANALIADSLTGKISNLSDSFDKMFNEIGSANSGVLYEGLNLTSSLVENYDSLGRVVLSLVGTYGAYRASLIVLNAVSVIQREIAFQQVLANIANTGATIKLTTAQGLQAIVTSQLTRVQAGLNAVMMANPYVAVATLVLGLASAVALLNTNEAIAERAKRRYNEEQKQFNKTLDETKQKTAELNRIVNDKTQSDTQQAKAFEKLQALYPNVLKNITLQQYKTMDATKAQLELNKAIDGMTFANLRTQLSNFDTQISSVKSKISQLSTTPQLGISGGTTGQYFLLQNQLKQLQADRQEYVVQINKVFDIQQKALKENNDKAKIQNKEFWQQTLKTATDALEKMPSSAKGSKAWQEQQRIIANANKELEKYSESTKRISAKSPEKITPFGTLEYWNEILNKLKDSITSYDKITGKVIGTSFDEKGKPVKKGVDITSQIANAEKKIQDLTYVSIADKTKELTKDTKDNFEVFNSELESIRNSAKSTTEYLERLAEARLLVMTGAFELTQTQQGEAVQLIDKASIEASKSELNSLLEKYRTTKGQMLQIEKEFNSDIETLNKSLANAKTLDEERQIADSIEARKKAFEKEKSALKVETLITSDDWNKLFGNLDKLTVDELIKLKNKIESEFNNLNLTPADLKSLRDKINEVTAQIQQKNPFKALSEAIKTYRKDQSSLNLKEVFRGISSSVSIVSQSFDQITGSLDKLGIKTSEETNQVLKDVSGMLQGSANLAMGIATGNPMQIVQGSIDVIMNGIDLIAGAGDRKLNQSIKQHQEYVDSLKISYNELEKAITKALGSDKYTEQRKLIENLRKQQEELIMMRNLESIKKNADTDKMKEYYQAYKDVLQQVSDTIDSIREEILGGSISTIANDLGSAIINAFSAGEDAAQAWGNKVDDIVGNVIRKMLIQQLVEQPIGKILQKYMSTWVDSEGNFMGFEGVIQTAQDMGVELKAFSEELTKSLSLLNDETKSYLTGTGTTGTNATSNKTLSGAIQTVTPETASIISGQLNAMRIQQIQGVQVLREQLLELNKITTNTGRLHEVVSILKEINTNNNRALGL